MEEDALSNQMLPNRTVNEKNIKNHVQVRSYATQYKLF